jgi:hypothetical protein
MIHCMAFDCVNPHVSFYEHEEAIRLWNHRPVLSDDRASG